MSDIHKNKHVLIVKKAESGRNDSPALNIIKDCRLRCPSKFRNRKYQYKSSRTRSRLNYNAASLITDLEEFTHTNNYPFNSESFLKTSANFTTFFSRIPKISSKYKIIYSLLWSMSLARWRSSDCLWLPSN